MWFEFHDGGFTVNLSPYLFVFGVVAFYLFAKYFYAKKMSHPEQGKALLVFNLLLGLEVYLFRLCYMIIGLPLAFVYFKLFRREDLEWKTFLPRNYHNIGS